MAHVFISYHKDSSRAYARKLADHLIKNGFDVWIDDRINYGEDWWKSIDQAIANAGAIIVIMTPDAENSRWVQRELSLSENRNKPVFPLLFKGNNWSIFVRTQYVVVTDESLPPQEFLSILAQYVIRQANGGKDVAQAPQRVAQAVEPPPPTLNVQIAPRKRNLIPAILLMILIIIAVVSFVSLWNILRGGDATPTVDVIAASTVEPQTQVWLDLTRTADAWTDTPTMTFTRTRTFTRTNIPTATPNATRTYQQLVRNRDATLTAVVPTPNGGGRGEIAFYSSRDGNFEIHVMNSDGSNLRNLTNNSANDQYPAWSPSGSRMTFISNRDGNNEIYFMNNINLVPYNLTNNTVEDYNPAYSPDGSQIVFDSLRRGSRDIYIMNTHETSQRRLTINTTDDYDPTWSSDGSQIAFVLDQYGNKDIYVMDADGTNQRRLTNNAAVDEYPAWSPDGSLIAFTTNRDGANEIYVMNADGGNERRLTYNSTNDWYPAWSPDGTRIAFVSMRDGNAEIYDMNANGMNQRRLTNDFDYDSAPAWRP